MIAQGNAWKMQMPQIAQHYNTKKYNFFRNALGNLQLIRVQVGVSGVLR